MKQAFNLSHCMCLQRGSNTTRQYRRTVALPNWLQIPKRILIPLVLCSPAEGPAVHVPPPATVFAVLCFQRLECQQLLSASRTVSSESLYCRLEQEAAFPVCRTLESHTRLALIHGARILWCGWHASILFIWQLIIVWKLEAFQTRMLELE